LTNDPEQRIRYKWNWRKASHRELQRTQNYWGETDRQREPNPSRVCGMKIYSTWRS
jgi:hypothetical protein